MRISEILFWSDGPTEEDRSDPQPGLPPDPSSDFMTKLASAFTKDGLVKGLWNLKGLEGQPAGLAPPDAEAELIPRGTLERTTGSW